MCGDLEGEINAKPETTGQGAGERGDADGLQADVLKRSAPADTPPPRVTLATFSDIENHREGDYIVKDIKGIAIR
jgi:hypothetical protein